MKCYKQISLFLFKEKKIHIHTESKLGLQPSLKNKVTASKRESQHEVTSEARAGQSAALPEAALSPWRPTSLQPHSLLGGAFHARCLGVPARLLLLSLHSFRCRFRLLLGLIHWTSKAGWVGFFFFFFFGGRVEGCDNLVKDL